MPETNQQLTLKKIIGAMLFAAKKPIAAAEFKKIFSQAAENEEDEPACRDFAKTKDSEITAALQQIKADLQQAGMGILLAEVAGGFRLQTGPECSPWLRQLLNSGRPSRLSKATLETLAIIAYRQPTPRAEIEGVRGVNVDSIVRHLLECQLIKITGRSDLPGHPLLYGTTQLFLEHFGLQSIDHLPGVEQLRRKEAERIKARSGKSPEEDAANTDVDGDDDDEDEQDVPEQKTAGQDKQTQAPEPAPGAGGPALPRQPT